MKRFVYYFIPIFLLVFVGAGAVQADPDRGKASTAEPSKTQTEIQKDIVPGQLDKANQDKNKKNKVKKDVQEKYITLITSNHEGNTPASFRDAVNHWARDSINKLAYAGIVSGYPDGTFKPDQSVTYAETLSMIMNTIDLPDADEIIDDNPDEEENNDVTINKELEKVPSWIRNQVKIAADQKIINLNRFHSEMQASRAQTAVILAKALNLEPVVTDTIPFNDGILISHEDLGYIIALYQEGILSGTPDGRFNPHQAITRAELATLIEKVLAKEIEDSAQDIGETEEISAEKESTQEDFTIKPR